PKVSSSSVTGTRKASEIQVSWDDVVPRSSWNRPLRTAGMASATCATQTASAAAASVPRVRRGGPDAFDTDVDGAPTVLIRRASIDQEAERLRLRQRLPRAPRDVQDS